MLFFVSDALAARPDDIGFVDSDEGHVRCHAAAEEGLARCADVVVWGEEAWAAQVTRLGFHAPPPDGGLGGSDALDIYLTPAAGGSGSAFVDCDGGDPDCVDVAPDDDRATTSSFVEIDPRTDDALFQAYVHHEFAHTLQYATDYTEPFLSLWEGTAVACEHWTDPAWPTSADDLADYQATPWVSAILQDGYLLADIGYSDDSWYEYGAVTWMFFLDDHYGDGAGSVGPAIWELVAPPGATVLDAWDTLSGDWRASLLDFTAERARMGTDAGPAWAAFAGDLGYAAREGALEVGDSVRPSRAPYPLGVSYYSLPPEQVTVRVDGDRRVDWAILAITAEDWTQLDSGDTIDGTDVTLAIVNLGPPGLVATDPLEPAQFTLTVGAPKTASPTDGCACGGTGTRSWWGIGIAAALWTRRRLTRR
jgi:hypothetical protein